MNCFDCFKSNNKYDDYYRISRPNFLQRLKNTWDIFWEEIIFKKD